MSSKWLEIRDALYTMILQMSTANGYNYDWAISKSKFLALANGVYARIDTGEEEEINEDEKNYCGTNQYREERNFSIIVRIDNPIGVVDEEEVIESCKDNLELALVDLKNKFNSVYNEAGDAGALNIDYVGTRFLQDDNADRFAPVKMEVRYKIKYIENRNIT